MKRIKIYFPFLVLFFSLIILNSCKKDDNPLAPGDDLVGSWELTKITITYQNTKYEYTPAQMNFYMTIIIKSDRTYQSTVTDQGNQDVESGTWSVSGSTLTVKRSNGTTEIYTYKISGNILTFEGTSPSGPNGENVPTVMEFIKK